MDIDKLEAYADQAAEQFKKDEEEKDKGYALKNQFKEIKQSRPNNMRKHYSENDKQQEIKPWGQTRAPMFRNSKNQNQAPVEEKQ